MSRPAHSHSIWQTKITGFTLVELLVTISIVAILSAIAAPSFRDFIAAQRIKAASYDIYYALTYARSEAIKRNVNVTLTQTTGGWQNGWAVTASTSTVPLSRQEGFSGLTITNSASSLVYKSDGRPNASTIQSFAISSSVSPSVSGRCVTIDLSGLPNSKTGTCP